MLSELQLELQNSLLEITLPFEDVNQAVLC